MNERIRELAEQAGLTKILNEHAHEFGNGQFENTQYPELSKFAELILRECIREIGYKSVELLDIDFYPHYQERLRKHFGVTE